MGADFLTGGPPGGGPGRASFWNLLDAPARTALRGAGRVTAYPAREHLLRQHDLTDHLIVIGDGCVKVTSVSAAGYQAVLALRGPGDLIGEQAWLDRGPRSATVTALTPVRALVIPADLFRAAARDHPVITGAVHRMLSARLRDADRHRTAAGADPLASRLAGLLLDLAAVHGRRHASGAVEIALPLSQDDIAGLVLGSRRTVSRVLEQWRADGWVSTGRTRLVLDNPDALKRISEGGAG
ncbi:Crp/Fnr family transcriptional regulator [Streptomyces thermodiastaticus]|jgi:CRP-like cAMP-binding protein|uniref:Crp/Fnr family transcriptional regulator n=1 Tax=Streptomyces thermodiastaticus TaxID=44061 RepID=UPI00167A28EA|nr:Crp/Fnr family transcriptional regulator [Streptomyces thermodiastaticus]MCE7551287.1 Crp/Fnr family transcriptional regulator [Streptomyces thermodiastaticus]GHF97401.1 Crp/Fnr family transcriptional regulator [Streptomyces thermodiastaticus]